ncbi:Uma2 family endonuclease [Methylobacterium variabile]|jgi:hypothetical protein|uniref:Uma2 family endonuclease n=1 Tax=Methylobacterium variabile TaxID=298794 RepID=UPI000AE83050|nr:Uma2 family endonuclease [Methylobacterium variabile]
MTGPAHGPGRLTVAEFDRFVDAQRDERDWELVDGDIVMMTNPTENHEQIAGNIGAPLKLAMDEAGCRSYQGGMRVQRDDNGRGRDKPKPDIVVRCGPRQNRTFVTDPLVIVEVGPGLRRAHGSGPRSAARGRGFRDRPRPGLLRRASPAPDRRRLIRRSLPAHRTLVRDRLPRDARTSTAA